MRKTPSPLYLSFSNHACYCMTTWPVSHLYVGVARSWDSIAHSPQLSIVDVASVVFVVSATFFVAFASFFRSSEDLLVATGVSPKKPLRRVSKEMSVGAAVSSAGCFGTELVVPMFSVAMAELETVVDVDKVSTVLVEGLISLQSATMFPFEKFSRGRSLANEN